MNQRAEQKNPQHLGGRNIRRACANFTRPLTEVIVEKLSCPTDIQPKKKRKITGVTPKLYKPFKQSLAELDVPAALGPLIKDNSPEPGFLRIWPEEGRDFPLVHWFKNKCMYVCKNN